MIHHIRFMMSTRIHMPPNISNKHTNTGEVKGHKIGVHLIVLLFDSVVIYSLLILCILMDSSIWFNTINLG